MTQKAYNEVKITFLLEHPLTDLRIIEALQDKGFEVKRAEEGDEKIVIVRQKNK